LRKNKKGQLRGASELGVGLLLLTLIVAVGAIVLDDVRTIEGESQCGGRTDVFTDYNATTVRCQNSSGGTDFSPVPNSDAVNVTTNGLSGLTNMSAQFGTVGTVAIAAVLIALVVAAFIIRRPA